MHELDTGLVIVTVALKHTYSECLGLECLGLRPEINLVSVSHRFRENFGRSQFHFRLKIESLGLEPQHLVYIPGMQFFLRIIFR